MRASHSQWSEGTDRAAQTKKIFGVRRSDNGACHAWLNTHALLAGSLSSLPQCAGFNTARHTDKQIFAILHHNKANYCCAASLEDPSLRPSVCASVSLNTLLLLR